jgi:ribosome biogenesis GTPase
MRKVRKQVKPTKHNRDPKPVRSKAWMPDSLDDPDALDALDIARSERIMPRGERERRQAVLAMAMADIEEQTDDAEELPPEEPPAGERGVVVEVSSSLCRVELNGRSLMCGLRGSLSAEETGYTNVAAVGDEVMVLDGDGSGRGIVEAVLPRRSALARPDVGRSHLKQVVVANADLVLIVASWRDPVIWLELIDHYLISARRSNLTPIICVNKVDLAEDEAACRATLRPYLDLGCRVIFTSALTGQGVDELRKVLRGQTTVLAGMSGVGKSSLLAAAQPGLQLRTGVVSDHSGEGRHTTTQVTMLKLEMGGFVVDTPGIREFGLSGLRKSELAGFYSEIAAVAGRCRFSDCAHIHEPGCAVKYAVRQGRVSEARYHNYKKIYHALPA